MDLPEVVIAVPARNEASRLPALLAALSKQRGAPRFALALLLDDRTDASRLLIARIAPTLPFRVITGTPDRLYPPTVGRARASAARLALHVAPSAAVLTTDADSEPDPDWIAASLRGLAYAEIVIGRIVLDDPECAPVQSRLIRYYDRLYRHRRSIDPVPWEDEEIHHWTSAASMAFQPNVYQAMGGFAPLTHGEDADFVDRAWRAGNRVRRDARAIVCTSTRRDSRVPGGFGDALGRLDADGTLPMVSHPHDEAWRYRWHARARRAFDQGRPISLAEPLRLDPADLARVAAEVHNGDAYAARVVGAPSGGMRAVSLRVAEAALASMHADMLEGAA